MNVRSVHSLWNMTTEIPVTQARDELAELLNRVAYGHERIILTRHSKPVACLVPPEDLQRLEPEGQEAISLTSTGQPPETSQSAGIAVPLRIAAQHRPPGQPQV
jgi:prevent-host-death family protein